METTLPHAAPLGEKIGRPYSTALAYIHHTVKPGAMDHANATDLANLCHELVTLCTSSRHRHTPLQSCFSTPAAAFQSVLPQFCPPDHRARPELQYPNTFSSCSHLLEVLIQAPTVMLIADDDFEHLPRASSLSQQRPRCASKAPEASCSQTRRKCSSVQLGTQRVRVRFYCRVVECQIIFGRSGWVVQAASASLKKPARRAFCQRRHTQHCVDPLCHWSAASVILDTARGRRLDLRQLVKVRLLGKIEAPGEPPLAMTGDATQIEFVLCISWLSKTWPTLPFKKPQLVQRVNPI